MDRKFKKDLRKLERAYKKCVEAFPRHLFHLTWVDEEEIFVLSGNSDTLSGSLEFDVFRDKLNAELFNKMYYDYIFVCGPIANPQTEYDLVNYTPEELAESEAYYERLLKEQSALETEALELEAEVHAVDALEADEREAHEAKVHKREAQLV